MLINLACDVACPIVRILKVALVRCDKPAVQYFSFRVTLGFFEGYPLPDRAVEILELIDNRSTDLGFRQFFCRIFVLVGPLEVPLDRNGGTICKVETRAVLFEGCNEITIMELLAPGRLEFEIAKARVLHSIVVGNLAGWRGFMRLGVNRHDAPDVIIRVLHATRHLNHQARRICFSRFGPARFASLVNMIASAVLVESC